MRRNEQYIKIDFKSLESFCSARLPAFQTRVFFSLELHAVSVVFKSLHMLYHSLFMASLDSPNVWSWITGLPLSNKWKEIHCALRLCGSLVSNQFLSLVAKKEVQRQSLRLSFTMTTNHVSICLWSTNSFELSSLYHNDQSVLELLSVLLCDIIRGILMYGPNPTPHLRLPDLQIRNDSCDAFNVSCLTLALLICIYEIPSDLRCEFVDEIKCHLARLPLRGALKLLMRNLGSNIEEQIMRSINLGITNWIIQRNGANHDFMSPNQLFSYALSDRRLWKVQVYCPLVAMVTENISSEIKDDRLLFSINYQQFEGMIQFEHKLVFNENWVDVQVNIDNIRCDLVQLAPETLMTSQGCGSQEKHFPSRISLQLTPMKQTNILSSSLSKSSDNRLPEVGVEKRPWKFEQSICSCSAIFNWVLHEGAREQEVYSHHPTKLELCQPRSWFRNRYTSATRQSSQTGGVILAGDEYKDKSVCWKMSKAAAVSTMEWELRGRIWLTYLPNKKKILYNETRRLEFRELLYLTAEK